MAVATANAIQGRAYACCIDFSAAFDRISWQRVMAALERTQMSYAYRRCIYLSFMISTCILWNGVFAAVTDPTRGVKQGGILAPYLFALAMQQLVQCCMLESAGVLVTILGITFFLNILVYADDILIFSRSVLGLKILLSLVIWFCEIYGDLEMNQTKSVLLTLNDRSHRFELMGLQHTESTEYLGTILNDENAEILLF